MSFLDNILKVINVLDKPVIRREDLERLIKSPRASIEFEEIKGDKGSTLFIKAVYNFGESGRCINIIGRLGGVGARPHIKGLVSDADGAIVALALANKLASIDLNGDSLPGTYVITTHVTNKAPIKPYKPVPMMESPVDLFELLKKEVHPGAEAVISIDATKANKVINHTGFAITHVVKDGWILKVSDEVLDIYSRVTGEPPVLVPLSMQDITPFTTKVYHINSIVQPWLYTNAPVLGVAITARTVIPGCSTGATNAIALEQASRFVFEVSREFVSGNIELYSDSDLKELLRVHGSLRNIMSRGAPP